jgi:hypothetical protein
MTQHRRREIVKPPTREIDFTISRIHDFTISLDSGLLAAIDEAAAARGLTRSAFLASAAREKIAAEG